MRWKLLLAMVGVLGGCSLSPLLDADVLDYFQVNDLASNRIILLNILRAKDGAPLHFSNLSQVRGQVSASLNASTTFPYGSLLHATSPRDIATIGGSVSAAPSFDVGSLDTKDFTMGVMAPITPETMRFFLDEGIDSRLVLLLLVSGVRTRSNQEVILNIPESARRVCYDRDISTLKQNELPQHYYIVSAGDPCPAGQSEFEFNGFLRVMNSIGRVYPATYREPAKTLGKPFVPNMHTDLRALAALDPKRFGVRPLKSGEVQLASAEIKNTIVLCQARAFGKGSVLAAIRGPGMPTAAPPEACVPKETDNAVDAEETAPPQAAELQAMTIRSTLEVIQYLGAVQKFEDAETAVLGRPRCVTLAYQGPDAGCGSEVLFNLQHDGSDIAMGINYGGQYWGVPASRSCVVPGTAVTIAGRERPKTELCDHSLETMAMVSLLLNQNKSAKDIPTTPAFQAVP